MKKIALIIGFGSIGKQYYKVLKKLKFLKKFIFILYITKKKFHFRI